MLKKAIRRSALSTGVAGVVLAATAAVGPTADVELVRNHCRYPTPAATSTSISVSNSVVQYGEGATATATVASGVGKPKGTLAIWGPGARKRTGSDSATIRLSRWLAAGETYPITASFNGSCGFQDSGDRSYLTVVKALTSGTAYVVNGAYGRFAAVFEGGGGVAPWGPATFVVYNADGTAIRSGSASLRQGRAMVDLPGLPQGSYRLVVTYSGHKYFEGSTAETSFDVTAGKNKPRRR